MPQINIDHIESNQESFKKEFITYFSEKLDNYHQIGLGKSEAEIEYGRVGTVVKWIADNLINNAVTAVPFIGPFIADFVVEKATLAYETYVKNIATKEAADFAVKSLKLGNKISETIEETAHEIARIYEYQIGMLSNEIEAGKLAIFAVDKIFSYAQDAIKSKKGNIGFTRDGLINALMVDEEISIDSLKSKILGDYKLSSLDNPKDKWRMYSVNRLLNQNDLTEYLSNREVNLGEFLKNNYNYPNSSKIIPIFRTVVKFEESLRIMKSVHGSNHHSVAEADTLNNIGFMYYQMGRYKDALERLELSLVMAQKFYDDNHPYVKNAISAIEIVKEAESGKKDSSNNCSIFQVHKIDYMNPILNHPNRNEIMYLAHGIDKDNGVNRILNLKSAEYKRFIEMLDNKVSVREAVTSLLTKDEVLIINSAKKLDFVKKIIVNKKGKVSWVDFVNNSSNIANDNRLVGNGGSI